MAQDYVEYLAVNVLNEQQLVHAYPRPIHDVSLTFDQVSYRSVSRALKVHSNLAKQ